jgi:hypothetical protein
MTFMRAFASLSAGVTVAALGSAAAFAAESPNLVGTWKSTGEAHAAVRLGPANDHHPQYDKASIGQPGDAWTLVIESQEGRAFHGHAKSPKGKDEPIVGVVSFDAEHFLAAGGEAGLFGEFLGDKIEICYQDHEAERASVACFIAAKQ